MVFQLNIAKGVSVGNGKMLSTQATLCSSGVRGGWDVGYNLKFTDIFSDVNWLISDCDTRSFLIVMIEEICSQHV